MRAWDKRHGVVADHVMYSALETEREALGLVPLQASVCPSSLPITSLSASSLRAAGLVAREEVAEPSRRRPR